MVEDLERFNEPKRQNLVTNITFVLLVFILISLIIFSQFYSFSKVVGDSMLDTIHNDDMVMCVTPKNLQRGDKVTAVASKDDGTTINIIKRIVAVEGDRLFFRAMGDGSMYPVELYLDSGTGFVLIEEDFIKGGVMTQRGFERQSLFEQEKYKLYFGDISDIDDSYIITIGEDEYFLMGDNRDNSTDSRNYGPFNRKDILGKVVKILSPGTFEYNIVDFLFSFRDSIAYLQ
ncbi:MAG: signal peptidase I [Clostridiales bacterium]|nr:signal peptidase I [Clostridiales bacterium]